ncbi:MAG TPA: AbrB/MazE/SpoVT family DNA-binding domain-containing protein [Tepidisphaeraceae bacterium]|nr:AbrB/MazE/SpoVT family DNA-binding domain-containing protein [Tepidisphaeraceae bacterium]
MTVRVQKWGNSLGVRIPKSIARQNSIEEGTRLEVMAANGRVILRPRKVPSLKELVAAIKPANRPPVVNWGKSVGREVW